MYRIVFIGTGGRSIRYAQAYRDAQDVEIAAIADPEAGHRATMLQRVGLSGNVPQFDDWREMLEQIDDIHGAVICTPNHLHADQAVPCLERGLPIALEKPLATTQADCERIISAERHNNGRTLLGFVLRSTPFYAKVHEWISRGRIGKLVSLQADELPGLGVSSIMNRSPWRRYTATSGGAMIEKSCHDMDILNWLMGCRPTSLCSYGGTRVFEPDPALPETCDHCHVGPECKYYKEPQISEHEDEGEALLHKFIREENRCIYNIDKDIADVQNIALEYESGAVATFMLNLHCMGPRAGRNLHAIGTEGRIWGNLGEQTVCLFDNASSQAETFDASGDGSGHGGGDRHHTLLLRRMIQEPDYRPDQNAYAGYLSAVMCFASDASRLEKRRVDFEYRHDGMIRF